METRYTTNTNLTINNSGLFEDLQTNPRALSNEYLSLILKTMRRALNHQPRTFLVRCDLHLRQLNYPDSPIVYDSMVITKFFKSLNAKIQHDLNTKALKSKRVHPCTMRYVWARERAEADTDHYHVAIFLNNDTYNYLGNYMRQGQNLATKIVEAWASALGIDDYDVQNLVHFPVNTPVYYVNSNAKNYESSFAKAFFRLSYFAKLETKHYGDRRRSFGCSKV